MRVFRSCSITQRSRSDIGTGSPQTKNGSSIEAGRSVKFERVEDQQTNVRSTTAPPTFIVPPGASVGYICSESTNIVGTVKSKDEQDPSCGFMLISDFRKCRPGCFGFPITQTN